MSSIRHPLCPPREPIVLVTNRDGSSYLNLLLTPVEGHRGTPEVNGDHPARIVAYDGENVITIHTSSMQSGITDVVMVHSSCDNYLDVYHKSFEKGDDQAYIDIQNKITEWIG